jgi:hypothetical protein
LQILLKSFLYPPKIFFYLSSQLVHQVLYQHPERAILQTVCPLCLFSTDNMAHHG